MSPSGFSLLFSVLLLALKLWLLLSSKQEENLPFLFSLFFWIVFSAEQGDEHLPHAVQGLCLSPGESCLILIAGLVLLSPRGRC